MFKAFPVQDTLPIHINGDILKCLLVRFEKGLLELENAIQGRLEDDEPERVEELIPAATAMGEALLLLKMIAAGIERRESTELANQKFVKEAAEYSDPLW